MTPPNLNIVCTGRDPRTGEASHESWPFGESIAVRIADHGRYQDIEVTTPRGQATRKGEPVEFRCPRCGRNPRFTAEDWHQVCAAWRKDGRDTLDVSTLGR